MVIWGGYDDVSVLSVSLYFADLLSDVQVVTLLYATGNTTWAITSTSILIAQFLVVYLRVLPFLHSTFGPTSCQYLVFLVLGFPGGCLALDSLMILEPFGLLSVLPLPPWIYKIALVLASLAIL